MKIVKSKDPKVIEKAINKQITKDLQILSKISDLVILYGLPEGEVADYGRINDEGSFEANIPARRWLSTVRRRYDLQIMQQLKKAVKKIINEQKQLGKVDKNRIASILELHVASALENFTKDNILNGHWDKNAPATIKKKGSSKPLIDTGLMISRVTSLVVDREFFND